MKGQNRQNRKPQTAKPLKKINQQELTALKQSYSDLGKLTHEIERMCYEKERTIRKIEVDFNKKYDHLSFSLENINETYKNHLMTLQKKYGTNVSFDLGTGEIRPNQIAQNDDNLDDSDEQKIDDVAEKNEQPQQQPQSNKNPLKKA